MSVVVNPFTYDEMQLSGGGGGGGGVSFSEVTDTVAGSAVTVDWSSGSLHYILLANGAQTITMINPVAGGKYVLLLQQPASGAAGTVTFSPVPLWNGAVTPVLTTTNAKNDVVSLVYSAVLGKYLGGINQNY